MNDFIDLEPVEYDPFSGPEIERIVSSIEPQMEIWASCMLGGKEASCAYIESVSLHFKGDFHFQAFVSALRDLVRRHESLRSVFNRDGSKMCVYKELQPDLVFEDITTKNFEEQRRYLDEFNSINVNTEFDLFNGPLIRTALFKLSRETYHFSLSLHHIVCDGWSIGILMQDLGKLYSAYATNVTPPSLPIAYQLNQYSAEQSAFVKSEAYRENEQYWVEQFANKIPFLDLPTDFPRPLLRTYKSKRQDFPVDLNLISLIKQTGAKAGCSLVTTLMAAFEVFLYRITNQEDIVIGIPAAGQSATGNYSLVGHCVNLLPVRSYPNGNFSFIEYLKERKSKILNDYDHQQFTFGSLLNKLNIARDPSRIPLVPVAFNIDIGLDDGVSFHGLDHKLISNPRSFESFEIFLNATGSKESFVLEWSYNTQLFKDSSISYMMEEFEFLLQCITKEPELEIRDIPVLVKPMIVPVTLSDYSADKTITDLFSEQVAKTPDNTAIVCGDSHVTYRELDVRSNQLAHYLQKKGVKPEVIVPLCMDRSVEMIIAIIGILKAGGSYLPIDAAYPADRIGYMLEDSKCNIAISSESCFSQLPIAKNRNIIVLEKEWAKISNESTGKVYSSAHPRSLAYIMYTSGSTGKPKGVMIEHENVVSLVNNPGYISLTSGDVLLSTGSPSFDATTFEYWGMLLNGGKLVLCDAETFLNSTLLKEEIATHKVNIMWFTTSLFNQLVNIDNSVFEKLKTILVGGEKLSEKHIDKIRKIYPAIEIINGYGPTENTTFSLTYKISETEISNTIPIGKPLNNRFAYVLDEKQQICSVGIVGELYVGGAGLGRGYLNRPDLTRERFLPDPFSNLSSGKMYKTGDLVRRLADGNVEYIGRSDDQVKIRGFRIEMPEIEAVLHQCPMVKHCVVTVNEDSGEKRLIAYIVPEGRFNREAINGYLRKKLPDYMIPKVLIELDKIPLTNNGKADKKALPKPDVQQNYETYEYVAPKTEFQKVLAEVWMSILGCRRISLNDDFFELGGHSLLALKAMLAIEKKTGKRLPLAMLLENSTIEKFSAVVERKNEEIKWDSFVPIKPSGTKPPIYFIHGAGLNVLTFRSISKHLHPEQPVYGLQAKGLNGKDEPLSRMEDIAAHYIGEILKHNPNGPYALAGYSFGGLIAYEMAKQLKELKKDVILLALFDTAAEQSDYYDPWSKKIPSRINTFFAKVWCTVDLMSKDPWFIIKYRIKSLRKKALALFEGMDFLEGEKDNFYIYSKKIIGNLFIAARDYKLTPYDGKIDLFRARRKTYYLPDFKYLGWRNLALGGITVHDVPGDHSEMFNHPNVEELAKILQESLDTAAEKGPEKKGFNSFLKVVTYAGCLCEMLLF